MACMTWVVWPVMARVKPEENEPVFHAEWEKRVFAMTMLGMGQLDP